MADFKKALIKLFEIEFNNNPKLALHEVSGDSGGLTYKGIAKNKNKNWAGWSIIEKLKNNADALEKNKELQNHVEDFYRLNYWIPIRGDKINSQEVAENIFLFGVNAGLKVAIKIAQRIVNVSDDGILGLKTLLAINKYNPEEFCQNYTALEKEYYKDIVSKNPSLAKFLKGWDKRAEVV